MDFDKYQYEASLTALPTAQRLEYLIPGLVAEAGEVAGDYAKFIRDETSVADLRGKLVKELGDVLWFIAQIAEQIDVDMSSIASANIIKLQDRQKRGVLKGSGNDR
jgi:NTP pyrophosphatase (non-canonical NTP hydrolase)